MKGQVIKSLSNNFIDFQGKFLVLFLFQVDKYRPNLFDMLIIYSRLTSH